jgi:hypothetical protein
MASGQTLCRWDAGANRPPASNWATPIARNSQLALAFDDSTAQSALFSDVLPRNYGGGGITLSLLWASASATSGNVVWAASFERFQSNTTSLDSDSFASEQSITVACPGTSGLGFYSTIAFTDGSQINSIAVGERFRLKIRRDAANGSDTMTGNAEIVSVELKET